MVVFDTSVLLLLLDPSAKPPNDPDTGAPLDQAAARIEHLVDTLTAAGTRVIIPTPVFSELLVLAGDAGPKYVQRLNGTSTFRVAPFDQKAAIEAAIMHRDALQRGGIRVDAAKLDVTRTKIKFDRQIVAIAKVEGAQIVYSDDDHVITCAKRAGLDASRTSDLDPPPVDPQQAMDFNG